MGNYFKLYSWMLHCFRDREFTINDFKEQFHSPQPTKVLHDLAKLGFIERLKRGHYLLRDPREVTRSIVESSESHMKVLSEVEDKNYAFSHSNALRIWSDGKYHLGVTEGFKPIHITVHNDDLLWWKKFLDERSVKYCVEGENKTLFGVVYMLHPREDFRYETLYEMPVVPVEEVIAYCEMDRESHGEALDHLKEHYGP